MAAKELGVTLFDVRQLRKRSLKSVADQAEISPAYLQKLERGDVKSPSPHVLLALGEALDIPYERLMELAGYLVPRTRRRRGERPGVQVLAQALNSEQLTADELAALARYLAWYREDQERQRSRGAGGA
jgi:HTH-type transcriptional regulator, competence development regulator